MKLREDGLTVKHRVGDQATGIDDLGGIGGAQGQWLTISVIQRAGAHVFALELIRVQTFNITPVVLVEVGEFVVEQDGILQIGGDVK